MLKKKSSAEERQKAKEQRKRDNEQLIYDSWHNSRALGKNKFALKFGIITWGLPTFIFYSVLMIVLNAIFKSPFPYDLYQAAISLFFFVFFGTIYGLVIWRRNEKIFLKKFPYGKKNG